VTQREETILKNVEEILIKRLDPGKIILFGSRARKIMITILILILQ